MWSTQQELMRQLMEQQKVNKAIMERLDNLEKKDKEHQKLIVQLNNDVLKLRSGLIPAAVAGNNLNTPRQIRAQNQSFPWDNQGTMPAAPRSLTRNPHDVASGFQDVIMHQNLPPPLKDIDCPMIDASNLHAAPHGSLNYCNSRNRSRGRDRCRAYQKTRDWNSIIREMNNHVTKKAAWDPHRSAGPKTAWISTPEGQASLPQQT